MKALISPLENNRICQVVGNTKTFPVAEPLFFVTCPSACTTEWTFDGQSFHEPSAPPVNELTQTEQFEQIRQALQDKIDAKARSFGFSGGNALILFAGFSNPFQSLALQFASWEVAIWVEAGQYKEQVLNGTQPMVTVEQAVEMMPEYI